MQTMTGGGVVCQDVDGMLANALAYNKSPKAPYRPIPKNRSGYANSNSFTFTLLDDVGLGGQNWTPSGWAPGWGIFVPWL